MRSLCVPLLLAAAATTAATTTASADVLRFTAEANAGGMTGTGTGGDQKDNAFFAKSPNLMYGAQIGGELFGLIDAWIQHHQYTDGSQLTTWTQFGAGLHFQYQLGSDKDRKARKNPFVEVGTGLWFGVGTGAQVMPPLDNAQITDKAFLVDGRFGIGKHLGNLLDFGVEVPVSYGFFFKNGNGIAANDTMNHYQAAQGEVMAFMRLGLKIL